MSGDQTPDDNNFDNEGETMNHKILKLCAWSGIMFVVLIGLGFGVMASFVPPPSPADTAAQTAQFFIEHKQGVRFGMIVSMVASSLLLPYAVAMTIHMRRIEGPFPALAMIELGMGALFVLEFIYLLFFWQAATFRVERAPELIQLLNDMAWIPFIGISSTLIMQAMVFGWAILIDKRPTTIFPRWVGFFNLWAGVMYVPGTFNVFFLTGPLAWDGWLAFYLPIVVFVLWMIVNSIYLAKAADNMRDELDSTGVAGAEGSLASNMALAAEVKKLRGEMEKLASKIGAD